MRPADTTLFEVGANVAWLGMDVRGKMKLRLYAVKTSVPAEGLSRKMGLDTRHAGLGSIHKSIFDGSRICAGQ